MDSQDKIIVCADCGKEFTHSVEDQKRYAERGFTQDPKRCRECRQVRKEKAASGPAPRGGGGGHGGGGYGGPRREGGGGGGGGGFRGGNRGPGRFQDRRGGGGGGGGFGRGPRQSFQAVCAACGVVTTVPFEPTQGREVFCRDCYTKLRGH